MIRGYDDFILNHKEFDRYNMRTIGNNNYCNKRTGMNLTIK